MTSEEIDFLKKTSEELDSIIECSYDGIYLTDGNGNTTRVNKAYERITGLNRNILLGKNMSFLEQKGYISKSATLMVLEKKEVVTITQVLETGKHILVTSSPIFNKDNEIIMVITNVRDETELYTLKSKLIRNKETKEKFKREINELKNQILDISSLIVKDEKMLDILKMAKRAAQTDVSILVSGESGVGKEEIVKFIHNNSKRKNKQFIKINCGAIPENLIESELFGYVKGAFTGANDSGKIGLFEVANGGTIFLDEIGELPLNMQVKLLRVLQESEVTKLGDCTPVKIDFRVVAATNRDLELMVKNGQFREDLLFRLNIVPLNILPLRERKEDIFELTSHFLKTINKKYDWNKTISSDVLSCFYAYHWPGNVRELKNSIERLSVMSIDNVITYEELPNKLKLHCKTHHLNDHKNLTLKEATDLLECELIEKAYKECGNVRSAAKCLGIGAATLVRKRQKYKADK